GTPLPGALSRSPAVLGGVAGRGAIAEPAGQLLPQRGVQLATRASVVNAGAMLGDPPLLSLGHLGRDLDRLSHRVSPPFAARRARRARDSASVSASCASRRCRAPADSIPVPLAAAICSASLISARLERAAAMISGSSPRRTAAPSALRAIWAAD